MQKITLLLVILVAFASCSDKRADNSKLQGVQWEAVYIKVNDSAAFNNPDPLPNLLFTSDSTISGNTGCNSFAGRYTLDDDNKITLSVGAMTMMFCMDVETEQIYIEQLQMAERYTLKGDTLTLYSPEKDPQIVFTKNKIKQ